ncbi:MAG: LacI family DNA-binding transcriptional regulator [Granulosicoccus sp.]
MPTQKDVARLASVSTATVSRVINRRAGVSCEVHKRVEQAIDVLAYRPHAGARALALQRSGTLGAIVPTLNNALFAQGINAFERCAQSLGYSFNLALFHDDPQQEYELAMRMIERGVDGLLLVGNDHDSGIFDRLKKASIRHVCAWTFDECSRFPHIGFDTTIAMQELVDHLLAHGHRKFGMLAGRVGDSVGTNKCIQGVVSRLNHHGLALLPQCIVEVSNSLSDGRKAFWELINNDVSAILCDDDVIAQGALLEAVKMGLSIPEDLSITGFGNSDFSAELSPSLTSVQINACDMGEIAARSLITAIENKTAVVSCQLDTQLVIRESSGVCKPLTLQDDSHHVLAMIG